MAFQFPRMRFGEFNNAQFAEITGMAPEQVRLWRSRGHIAARGGRNARYPAGELAEAMVRYDLARNGIPPSESVWIGYECAGKILRYVMFNHPEACEVRGPQNAVDWLKDLHQNTDTLTKVLYGAEAGDELLVRIDGGELEYRPSEDAELHTTDYRCALVLNLQGYAERMVRLAGKPIIIFKLECREGEDEVRSTLAGE